jgi:AcrR family transcriptional regulator
MSDTTRGKILRAALSSFAVNGYEGTTLAHVAGAVGIRKPSLYNHFSSKDELFFTVAKNVMEEWIEVMLTSSYAHNKKPAEQRIYLVLADSTHFIQQKHEGMLYKRLMLFPPAALVEDLRMLVESGDEKMDEILKDFYEQGRNEGILIDSFTVFRAGFYCLMDGLFTESFIYREKEEFQERLEGAWTVFWRGVSK